MLLLLAAVAVAVAPMASGAPLLNTTMGAVRGVTLRGGRVHAFLGVPFAAPPTGELRFRPPQAPEPWEDVFDGTHYGNACVQHPPNGEFTVPPPGVDVSEDCLNINCWVPSSPAPRGGRAVMFWIYGGAFNSGFNSETRTDGAAMADEHDVVVCSVNYRLQVFGFLAHVAVSHGNGALGNYGLLDQRAGMKWVHENADALGADVSRMTIFGESAGGSSVCLHLVMPASHEYFTAAIPQSPACFAQTHYAKRTTERARQLIDDVGCRRTTDTATAACLREVPAQTLLKAGNGTEFATIDGIELRDHPLTVLKSGKAAKVPLLGGTVADEGSLFARAVFRTSAIDSTTYAFAILGVLNYVVP